MISKITPLGNYTRGVWVDVNLLSKRQMKGLFYDAELIMQRVTIIAETIIAVK